MKIALKIAQAELAASVKALMSDGIWDEMQNISAKKAEATFGMLKSFKRSMMDISISMI